MLQLGDHVSLDNAQSDVQTGNVVLDVDDECCIFFFFFLIVSCSRLYSFVLLGQNGFKNSPQMQCCCDYNHPGGETTM